MPNLSLAEAREKILDICAKLTSARDDLTILRYQLGFREGRRNLIGEFIQELDQEIRFLMAMYHDIELDPDAKSAAVE